MARALALVLVLPLAVAVAGASAAEDNRSCSAVRIGTADAPATGKRRARKKPSFSASQILDLVIQVELRGPLGPERSVELKLYTPKGHLYQTLPARVEAGAEDDSETRRRRRAKHAQASATLPVAGTTIVTSSLYGTWRVQAHLDGGAAPCSRAQEFAIEP